MKMLADRAVLTVERHEGRWAVAHEGGHFGHSADKEEAKAAANKRARQMLDAGQPCQVRITGRLAELGMALAEDLQAAALAAEEPAQKAALADGFHKLSRSVRQSLALEARLAREAQRAHRDAEDRRQAELALAPARR